MAAFYASQPTPLALASMDRSRNQGAALAMSPNTTARFVRFYQQRAATANGAAAAKPRPTHGQLWPRLK